MPRHRKELHWGRLITCIADRPDTVQDLLRRSFGRMGEAPAIADADRLVSYRQLAARAESLSAGLRARGVRRGDRVAVMLPNGADAVISVAAIVFAGAVIVPIGTRLRRPEIEYIFQDCAPAALIHGREHDSELNGAAGLPGLRLVAAGDDWATLLSADEAAPSATGVTERDLFGILYTSGTTGRPKGAMLTHLNVVHSCLHWEEVHRLGQGERTLLGVPWSHVAGLCGVVLPFLHVGGLLITMAEFKRREFLRLAERERITHALLVPAMYGLCLLEADLATFDLSAWRIGAYGSAPMPEPTAARFAAAFPNLHLCNCYGATETTSPATIMPQGEGAAHPGSVGRAVPCGELRVMDAAGREVTPGESGEIWIGGPMVVPGYWQREAATRAEFAAGFWKSGDIGSVDADGYVYIFDRKKDMINRGGFKIYPAELESALAAMEGVVEAAIVGRPDPVLGEAVVAFLTTERDDMTPETVRAWCAARMADYKVPGEVVIGRFPLPRNANGKLQKAELRALLGGRQAAPAGLGL